MAQLLRNSTLNCKFPLPFIELFYKPPPIPQFLKVYIREREREREREMQLIDASLKYLPLFFKEGGVVVFFFFFPTFLRWVGW
jgi:hypothetical protein